MKQMFKSINAKELAGVLILIMAFTITLYGVIVEPNGQIHSSVQEYNISMLAAALGCFGIGTFGQKFLNKMENKEDQKVEQKQSQRRKKTTTARKAITPSDNKQTEERKDTNGEL